MATRRSSPDTPIFGSPGESISVESLVGDLSKDYLASLSGAFGRHNKESGILRKVLRTEYSVYERQSRIVLPSLKAPALRSIHLGYHLAFAPFVDVVAVFYSNREQRSIISCEG